MAHYTPKQEWDVINKFFAEKLEAQDLHDLGIVFKEYVEESVHMGWEGFTSDDVRSIRKFLKDFVIYHKAR